MDLSGEVGDILRRVGEGPDHPLPVAEAALALSALRRPRVGLERYFRHLDELGTDLAADVARAGALTADEAAIRLCDVMAKTHGYSGDDLTYDDLQNANLLRVIDRRKGLPVALGILYIHAARAQGWTITGLAFPGHFLLQLEVAGGRAVIDPFHNGVTRATHELRELLKTVAGADAELQPAHYAPVTDREILLRLQNNVKLRLLQQENTGKAADIVEQMTVIAPGLTDLWRELGLIRAAAGQMQGAIEALETYLARAPDAARKHDVATLLQRLKGRLN